MIEIKNLNLSYGNQIIFKNDNIRIDENKVTVISGKSGCGKTSLLRILALEDINHEYYLNGHDISESNQESIELIKKNHIVYFSQDETLIPQYSVKYNAKLLIESKGNIFDEKKFIQILDKVGINKSRLKQPLSKLSNGEKQRMFIVCATFMDAWLYIFDEPISSLDEEYQRNVFELIKTLAKNGRTVVMTSHEKIVDDEVDQYEIKDQMVHTLKQTTEVNDEVKQINDRKINIRQIVIESFNHLVSFPFINSVILIMLSIVITIASIFNFLGNSLQERQVDTLNGIYDSELFLINSGEMDLWKNGYYSDNFLAISNDKVLDIQKIEHVENAYPYQYFYLDELSYSKDTLKPYPTNMEEIGYIEMNSKIHESKKIFYTDVFQQFLTVDPVYPHQNIAQRLQYTKQGVDKGFYISSFLAQKLGITEINDETLKINVNVPIASNPACISFNSNEETKYFARGAISIRIELELPIKGILKKTTMNYYHMTEPNIFLDYQYIDEIINETRNQYLDLIESKKTELINSQTVAKFWPYQIYEDKFNPSCYVIKVDSIENLELVKSDLQKIDTNFLIRGLQVNGGVSKDVVTEQKQIISMFNCGLALIVVVLIYAIKIFKKKKNIQYYQYLRRIGWNNSSILLSKIIETLFFIAILTILIILTLILIKPFTGMDLDLNILKTISIFVALTGILNVIGKTNVKSRTTKN